MVSEAVTGSTVISVNLQRGRDAFANKLRRAAINNADVMRRMSPEDTYKADATHRGDLWWNTAYNLVMTLTSQVAEGTDDVARVIDPQETIGVGEFEKRIKVMHNLVVKVAERQGAVDRARMVTTSYRSAPSFRIRMDSMVCRWFDIAAMLRPTPKEQDDIRELLQGTKELLLERGEVATQSTKRKLAATKAIRTMKLQAR
jgi:hypothetical protein